MATTRKKTAKVVATKSKKPRSSLAALLAEAGRPFGPTLDALLALAPQDEYLRVGEDVVGDDTARRLLDDHGIVVIGRAAHGYFGVLETFLGKTLDATPIAYADRQGIPPEVAGRDLAAFLALWCYVPSFFVVQASSPAEWKKGHRDPERAESADVIAAVEALPGVAPFTRAEEVVQMLRETVRIMRGSAPGPRAGSLRDIEAIVKTALDRHVGKSNLLVDLESVALADGVATVVIGVNAERKYAPQVVKHAAVDGPLRAMLAEVRPRVASEVVLKFQCVSEGGPEGERSLALALRHAGADDLARTLGLA